MNPRIALIGCGNWGKNIARVLAELNCLYAICDIDERKPIGFIGDRKFTPYSDIIMTDEKVDAVVIATPPKTHYQLAKKALDLDKDVFVEKPMCLDMGEAIELVNSAGDKKKILMVGHILLYHPHINMKEKLDKIGKIKYIFSIRFNNKKPNGNDGVLWNLAPHDISLILDLLGETPTTCETQGDKNCTQTILNFGDRVKAYIQTSRLYPTKKHELVVVGEKDSFVYEYNETDEQILQITDKEPLKVEMNHFLNCIKTRSKPLTDGWHGLKVLTVLKNCEMQMRKTYA